MMFLLAYDEIQLNWNNIDYFSLYDCFRVCLIRAIESVGFTQEYIYNDMLVNGKIDINKFAINTHGAPWEVCGVYQSKSRQIL